MKSSNSSVPVRIASLGLVVLVVTLLIATMGGCMQPLDVFSASEELDVRVDLPAAGDGGLLEIRFTIPNYEDASRVGPRAVAPQTRAVALLLNNQFHSEIAGDLTSDTWNGTFTGVPPNTYDAGAVTVELRDGDGNALTRGSSTAAVTVTDGGNASVSISCVPANPTELSLLTPVAATVERGSMTYFSFDVVANTSYQFWTLSPTTAGRVVLFDATGAAIGSGYLSEGYTSDQGFRAQQSGTYYAGVYAEYEYDGGACTLEAMIADETPALMVDYRAEPSNGPNSTHVLTNGATFDLGDFDQGQTVGWNDELDITIRNLGADGDVYLTAASPYVTVSGDGALTLLSGPSDQQIRSSEEFTLDLDTDSLLSDGSSTLSFTYDLRDDSGSVLSSETYSVTLTYDVVEPRPRMEVSVGEIGDGSWTDVSHGDTVSIGHAFISSEESAIKTTAPAKFARLLRGCASWR